MMCDNTSTEKHNGEMHRSRRRGGGRRKKERLSVVGIQWDQNETSAIVQNLRMRGDEMETRNQHAALAVGVAVAVDYGDDVYEL